MGLARNGGAGTLKLRCWTSDSVFPWGDVNVTEDGTLALLLCHKDVSDSGRNVLDPVLCGIGGVFPGGHVLEELCRLAVYDGRLLLAPSALEDRVGILRRGVGLVQFVRDVEPVCKFWLSDRTLSDPMLRCVHAILLDDNLLWPVFASAFAHKLLRFLLQCSLVFGCMSRGEPTVKLVCQYDGERLASILVAALVELWVDACRGVERPLALVVTGDWLNDWPSLADIGCTKLNEVLAV